MPRSKKQKNNKMKIWIPLLCIVGIVIGITFYMLHDIQNKIEEMDDYENLNSIINDENQVIENEIVENTATENTISNRAEVKNQTNLSQSTSTTQTSTAGITDQKQKAVELVKQEWGEDDSVEFVFDYVNEDGEYVVAVKNKQTATTEYYFRVNLDTETVELD